MDLDRFKDAIREALREEAEKIAARGDEVAMAALFAGAEIRMAERVHGFTTNIAADGYYAIGRSLADRIEI